jgi:hypothetical protein
MGPRTPLGRIRQSQKLKSKRGSLPRATQCSGPLSIFGPPEGRVFREQITGRGWTLARRGGSPEEILID